MRETLAVISGEAVLSVGEARHDVTGAAEALLQRHLPRRRGDVRRVVALRPHRPHHRGDQGRFPTGIDLCYYLPCLRN